MVNFSLLFVTFLIGCGEDSKEAESYQTVEHERIDPNIYTEQGETIPTDPDPMPSPVEKKLSTESTVVEPEYDGPTITLLIAQNPWGDKWDAKITLTTSYLPDGYTAVLVHAEAEPTDCNDSNITASSNWSGDLGVYTKEPGTYWFRACILDNETGLYSKGKTKSYEVIQ